MKKLGLSLSGIFVTGMPIITVISCSSEDSRYDYSVLNEELDAKNINSLIGSAENGLLASLGNIVGRGSSSVLPILNSLKVALTTMQYEPTGSGDGLKVGLGFNPVNATGIDNHDFGMTSSTKRPTVTQEWDNVRTVTWAIDAIGIALNLPNGITITDNERPVINIAGIAKLYDNEADTSVTWAQLLENEDTNNSSSDALAATPVPLGRVGGKGASGTSDGFWHTLSAHLPQGSTADLNHDHLTTNGGKTTSEANSAALNALKQEAGSITYLSLGYAVQNQDQDMVVATIKVDETTSWNPVIANVNSGNYAWRRPFNIIYSVDPIDNKGVKMAQLLLSTEGQRAAALNGFVPLTSAQFDTQFSHAFDGNNNLAALKVDLVKSDITKINPLLPSAVDSQLGLTITTS